MGSHRRRTGGSAPAPSRAGGAIGSPALSRSGNVASTSPRARRADGGEDVRGVRISHPDRVIYPALRLTKLDVARYYERIAPWMMPHVEGRPLTLVRCPQGVGGTCFYMRHTPIGNVGAPEALRRIRIRETKKTGEYLVSVPIAWDELTPRLSPERYTIVTVFDRLRRLKTDPWRDYWKTRQVITREAMEALSRL
jgi:DNA primase